MPEDDLAEVVTHKTKRVEKELDYKHLLAHIKRKVSQPHHIGDELHVLMI
ncbi:12708_t:CDS:2, partial [Dentiscutata erythropus]